MKECVNEGISFDGLRTSFLVFSVVFGVFVVFWFVGSVAGPPTADGCDFGLVRGNAMRKVLFSYRHRRQGEIFGLIFGFFEV